MNAGRIGLVGLALSVFALSATAQDKKWTCDAPNLVTFSYSGGDRATIQLRGYSMGGSYTVKKNAEGDTATGVTADGTAFTCKLK